MNKEYSILVVDDSASVAFTLQKILELQGYRVQCAHSAREALAVLCTEAMFDVVIADLHMETENIGLDVAQFASRLKPRPVVVLCTGSVEPDDTAADFPGIDLFISKPVSIHDLTSDLALLLASRPRDLGSVTAA